MPSANDQLLETRILIDRILAHQKGNNAKMITEGNMVPCLVPCVCSFGCSSVLAREKVKAKKLNESIKCRQDSDDSAIINDLVQKLILIRNALQGLVDEESFLTENEIDIQKIKREIESRRLQILREEEGLGLAELKKELDQKIFEIESIDMQINEFKLIALREQQVEDEQGQLISSTKKKIEELSKHFDVLMLTHATLKNEVNNLRMDISYREKNVIIPLQDLLGQNESKEAEYSNRLSELKQEIAKIIERISTNKNELELKSNIFREKTEKVLKQELLCDIKESEINTTQSELQNEHRLLTQIENDRFEKDSLLLKLSTLEEEEKALINEGRLISDLIDSVKNQINSVNDENKEVTRMISNLKMSK